jgi:hypothetical protein
MSAVGPKRTPLDGAHGSRIFLVSACGRVQVICLAMNLHGCLGPAGRQVKLLGVYLSIPIVLYIRRPHVIEIGKQRLVLELPIKLRRTEVSASSLGIPGAHRQARFQVSTLVRTEGAIGTRIVHVPAPAARLAIWSINRSI